MLWLLKCKRDGSHCQCQSGRTMAGTGIPGALQPNTCPLTSCCPSSRVSETPFHLWLEAGVEQEYTWGALPSWLRVISALCQALSDPHGEGGTCLILVPVSSVTRFPVAPHRRLNGHQAQRQNNPYAGNAFGQPWPASTAIGWHGGCHVALACLKF